MRLIVNSAGIRGGSSGATVLKNSYLSELVFKE